MVKFELANEPDLYSCFVVMSLAIFTSLISEGLSWLFIYRTTEYKELKKDIDALTRKIEKKKLDAQENKLAKVAEKKIQIKEAKLKDLNQAMGKTRMKSTFFIAILMIIFISSLSSAYQVLSYILTNNRE